MRKLAMAVMGCAVLLASVNSTVSAAGKPTGTEFSDGWNTFATAKVGDWAEYVITADTSRRVEVTAVNGDKITVTETLTLNGKAQAPKERKPADWWSVKMPAMIPTNFTPEWETKELTYGGVKLKCSVATWMNQSLKNEIWFSKDVRCGGYVKMVMGGNTGVWLKNYGDAGKKEGYLSKVDNPDAGKGPSLPGFYTTAGNVAVHKTTKAQAESFSRRESEGYDGKTATFSDTPCDKDGKALPDAKPVSSTITAEIWANRYAKPKATGERIKAAGGEQICSLYEFEEGGNSVKEWVTAEGVLVKSEIKDKDGVMTTIELVSIRFR